MKTKMNYKFVIVCTVFAMFSVGIFAQDSPKLMDNEIASVAVTANQIDIDYAKVALKRSKNKEVIDFANTMSTDHLAIINQAVKLVTKLGVTPKDNAVSQSLMKQAKQTLAKLEKVDKKDFDKTYIDNEVVYHQAVIDTVKNLLIPQAKNQELKDLLETVMPALEAHLEHAKMVQG
ncbi:MAG: DUF4142 domain-containing protein [Xanthomarina sp.]